MRDVLFPLHKIIEAHRGLEGNYGIRMHSGGNKIHALAVEVALELIKHPQLPPPCYAGTSGAGGRGGRGSHSDAVVAMPPISNVVTSPPNGEGQEERKLGEEKEPSVGPGQERELVRVQEQVKEQVQEQIREQVQERELEELRVNHRILLDANEKQANEFAAERAKERTDERTLHVGELENARETHRLALEKSSEKVGCEAGLRTCFY